MKKLVALFLSLCLALGCASFALADGNFEGTAQGFGGAVTVQVTLENDKIVAVTATGEAESSPAIGNDLSSLAEQVLTAQGAEIDG
ncbi:MAG: hypothetical protein IJ601_12665, partial [Acidaminococcaceae bacterium]|nr:hypothetical protein [Acidaminococcaceae bacterium]